MFFMGVFDQNSIRGRSLKVFKGAPSSSYHTTQPQPPAPSPCQCSQHQLQLQLQTQPQPDSSPSHTAPAPSPCSLLPAPSPATAPSPSPKHLLRPSRSTRPSPKHLLPPSPSRTPAPAGPQPFLLYVLQTLDHLTKAFQLINSSIVHCLDIVEALRLDLENSKSEYISEHIASLLADGSTLDRACGVSAII